MSGPIAEFNYSAATLDMWVLEIDPATYGFGKTNTVLRAFNVLSPGVGKFTGSGAPTGGLPASMPNPDGTIPMTPSPDGVTPNVRVDIRIRNYGADPVTIRTESQTVASGVAPDQSCTDPNWVGTQNDTCGKLIVAPYATLQPSGEGVFSHWFPMWNPQVHTGPMPNGVDERFWVRNQAFGANGVDCSTPPPWTACGRVELFDFASSSRHLVHMVPTTAVGLDILVIVHNAATSSPIQGATVTLNPSNVQLTTDVDGLVDFGVTAGTYSVLVHANGFNDGFVANIIVPPNQQVSVDLTGGTPILYSCVSGQCVIDPNGQYATLDECVNACGTTPTKYTCVDGVCHPDANGQYNTLEECQAACKGKGPSFDPQLAAEIGAVGLVAGGLMLYGVRKQNKGKKK